MIRSRQFVGSGSRVGGRGLDGQRRFPLQETADADLLAVRHRLFPRHAHLVDEQLLAVDAVEVDGRESHPPQRQGQVVEDPLGAEDDRAVHLDDLFLELLPGDGDGAGAVVGHLLHQVGDLAVRYIVVGHGKTFPIPG